MATAKSIRKEVFLLLPVDHLLALLLTLFLPDDLEHLDVAPVRLNFAVCKPYIFSALAYLVEVGTDIVRWRRWEFFSLLSEVEVIVRAVELIVLKMMTSVTDSCRNRGCDDATNVKANLRP